MGELCGVDEAGRGAVIGPMVVAALSADRQGVRLLQAMGVKDSKKLSEVRRRSLFLQLKASGLRYRVKVVKPEMINAALRRNAGPGINVLEARLISSLLEELNPSHAYIDSPDRDLKRFREMVARSLGGRTRIICENKADSKYPIVSAASIVAKVTRDRLVANLRRKYGDFGSGYPSDPKTILFIRRCIRDGALPDIVRRGWDTIYRITQTSLDEF
ncbi:Ribonuclease HII [archaeon HR01]|nr:Ribonuclease HII [archaeon HR01]